MNEHNPDDPVNPIFVTGVWRSGTSLLASLLNKHSEIALMYECAVLDFPRLLEAKRFKGEWLSRQEFFNRALSRHGLIYAGSLRGLEQVASPEDLYKAYATAKSASHWGEKAPAYARRLRMLADRFPRSAIILIWRDAEQIMRSVREAGNAAPFFRRHGKLSRVLGCHERMLADAAALERAGHRLLQVDYDGLVDDPEGTMREISRFLGVSFEPRTTSLEGADFTTMFESPIHRHLRAGVIVRQTQQTHQAPLPAKLSAKLARFRHRALRLRGMATAGAGEPSAGELLLLRISAGFWGAFDGVVRLLFEFLPLPWLQSYRSLKAAFAASGAAPRRAGHLPTILAAYGVLALNVSLKFIEPNLVFLPLSLLPCAALTVVIDRRWGIFAAGVSAIAVPIVEWMADSDYASPVVLLWNAAMRFATLVLFIFILDAVRANSVRNQTA